MAEQRTVNARVTGSSPVLPARAAYGRNPKTEAAVMALGGDLIRAKKPLKGTGYKLGR
jgi:hypothetical protein